MQYVTFSFSLLLLGNTGLYGTFKLYFMMELHFPVFYSAFEKSDARPGFSFYGPGFFFFSPGNSTLPAEMTLCQRVSLWFLVLMSRPFNVMISFRFKIFFPIVDYSLCPRAQLYPYPFLEFLLRQLF